jgi:pimeloyl-ACP methyl ester carboxylesterase
MSRAAALEDEHASSMLRGIRYGALSLAARLGLTGVLTRRLVAALGPTDGRALTDPHAGESLELVVGEAFAQWGKAATLEAGLFMQPWDFDPARITQPVRLWHGTEDTRIPFEVAKALADRIPNAEAVLWPHHGHFSWALGDNITSIAEFLTTSSN